MEWSSWKTREEIWHLLFLHYAHNVQLYHGENKLHFDEDDDVNVRLVLDQYA